MAWGLALLLAFAAPSAAQETITSDRPGIGSGAGVVGPGILQAEFGGAWFGGDGADALNLGQLFVRYGFGAFEVEVLGNSWVKVQDGGPDGFQDLGVGAKVRVAEGIGGRANLSLQGLLSVPVGSDEFTSDEWQPTLVALADIGLGATTAVSVNAGYQVGTGDLDGAFFASVTPGISLTDQVGAYAGWAGSFSGGGDTNWIEGGVTFLANSDMQLDVNGATSPDTDAWFLGVGMAIRTGTR
jgi:hypothetical protein